MDLLRIITAVIVNIFVGMSSVPPSKEMGTLPGDRDGEDQVSPMVNQIIVLIATTFSCVWYGHYWVTTPLGWLDIFLLSIITLGWALRMWSYAALGNLFTFSIGIREKHELIQTGPYRYLVHPSYTGQALLYIGSMLYCGAPYVFTLIVTIFIIIKTIVRIQKEEDMLIDHFGTAYINFVKTRSRLIPYVF